MCVVSNMGDEFNRRWPQSPWQQPIPMPQLPQHPNPYQPSPWQPGGVPPLGPQPAIGPTREQFDEFLDLFRKAKEIDRFLGTPDCEMEEKLRALRAHAVRLGLDPAEVLK